MDDRGTRSVRRGRDCRLVAERGGAVRGEVYMSGGSRRWTTAVHAACMGRCDCRLRAGQGEERTANMANMFVTLEVLQLEISASKFVKV